MAEITELLDQLSPEELSSILQTIENDGLIESATRPAAAQNNSNPTDEVHENIGSKGEGFGPPQEAAADATARHVPVPPASPPTGTGRRPCRGTKPSANGTNGNSATGSAENDNEGDNGANVTMSELKRLLEEHSAGVVSEVRKLLPDSGMAPAAPPGETIDMGTLTRVLAERDQEEKALEARLADLQAELVAKEKRVAELSGELDTTVREVRHRQLDLEFQQLKLEERVRSNAELEQAQQNLSARVAEASLSARHATIDADMCRFTPRAIRAQGTLPWTLRKNKLPGL